MRHLISALALIACATPAMAQTPDPAVSAAIADPARKPENRARDPYRHPAETLAFFGVKPGQTVVEFSPAAGWYTEILAPLAAKGGGQYVGLVSSAAGVTATEKLIAGNQPRFGAAKVALLDVAAGTSTLPPASADVVLTFRNVHNLIMNSDAAAEGAFRAFYAALKPGGTLGVVDHRLPEARDTALEKKSGYLKRSTIVRLAEKAGFRLAGESEVNANPKDTADWPEGVWTLPPSYQLKDKDRAKYAAIGESDRMTLKFVKPATVATR